MLQARADGLHHQTCPTSALLLYYISISISRCAVSPSPTESTETFFAATSSLFYAQRYFSFIFIEKIKYKNTKIRERWKNKNQIRRKETREKTELQVKFEKNSKFSKKWPEISKIPPETFKNVLKIPTQATSDPNLGWFLSKRTIMDFFNFRLKIPKNPKSRNIPKKFEIYPIS